MLLLYMFLFHCSAIVYDNDDDDDDDDKSPITY